MRITIAPPSEFFVRIKTVFEGSRTVPYIGRNSVNICFLPCIRFLCPFIIGLHGDTLLISKVVSFYLERGVEGNIQEGFPSPSRKDEMFIPSL